MCGVLVHMNDEKRNVVANDLNTDVILLWKAVQQGWLPENKHLSKTEFEKLKNEKPSKERCFYGINCAFNNQFLGGYRYPSNTINYVDVSIRNLKKANINNVKFYNKSYLDFKPKGKLIYCDPPYINNSYKHNKFFDFDYDVIWDTMRKWSKDNIVVISEYNAPKDFECIWIKKTNYNFNTNGKSKTDDKFEKLFIYLI